MAKAADIAPTRHKNNTEPVARAYPSPPQTVESPRKSRRSVPDSDSVRCPKAVKSEMEAVEPRTQAKSATALPELAEVEVKSVPVHFPKEGPLDGAIQPSAEPSTDYGVIQRRYRNTIAILGKIQ